MQTPAPAVVLVLSLSDKETRVILPPADVSRNQLSGKTRQKALARAQGKKGEEADGRPAEKGPAEDGSGHPKQSPSLWHATRQVNNI